MKIRYKVIYNDRSQPPVVVEGHFRTFDQYEQLMLANARTGRMTEFIRILDAEGGSNVPVAVAAGLAVAGR